MINVKEEKNGSFTISWDENDPQESILNTWTEEDFINCITKRCKEVIYEANYNQIEQSLNFNSKNVQESNYEGFNQTKENFFYGFSNSEKSKREYQNPNITEATEEDWKNFWEDPDYRIWEG